MKRRIYQDRVYSVTISNRAGRPIERLTGMAEHEASEWAATFNALERMGRVAMVTDPEPKARQTRKEVACG